MHKLHRRLFYILLIGVFSISYVMAQTTPADDTANPELSMPNRPFEDPQNMSVPDMCLSSTITFENDPTTNADANACFEGGSLAGRCDSSDVNGDGLITDFDRDWMYTSGWYLIRWECSLITREEIPEPFRPQEPVFFEIEDDTFICIVGGTAANCPSTILTCAQLFTCQEARDCLAAGANHLDSDGDCIPCEDEPTLMCS